MATTFRRPYNVITRPPGVWQDGKYYNPPENGVVNGRLLTIQAPSSSDASQLEATPYYSRQARFIKVYSDVRLNPVSQEPGGSPGDLILYDNKRYLVIREAIFQTLRTRVSHYRYFAAEMMET